MLFCCSCRTQSKHPLHLSTRKSCCWVCRWCASCRHLLPSCLLWALTRETKTLEAQCHLVSVVHVVIHEDHCCRCCWCVSCLAWVCCCGNPCHSSFLSCVCLVCHGTHPTGVCCVFSLPFCFLLCFPVTIHLDFQLLCFPWFWPWSVLTCALHRIPRNKL